MTKIILIVFGVIAAGVALFGAPYVYEGLKIGAQMRSLRNRSDNQQIAVSCVNLVHSVSGGLVRVSVADPRVPEVLRSLHPGYILASTNGLTMEFHGGFEHYGYRLRQSERDSKQWTLSFYNDQNEELLTTVTRD